MADLTKLELLNLKHLIEINNINYQKLIFYSDQCVDPQIKQAFTKGAQDALNIKQKLLAFLN